MSSSAHNPSSRQGNWDSPQRSPDNRALAAPHTEQAHTTASDSSEVVSGRHPLLSVRQIFDEHARYVWRTLRHLGVADADLEDVCQEVFVTVHRKLPEFEGRSKLRTWLYGICLRVASDYRRRAYVRRERPGCSDTGEGAGGASPSRSESEGDWLPGSGPFFHSRGSSA